MSLVGRKIAIVDEKTGEEQVYSFTNTPFNRAFGIAAQAVMDTGLSTNAGCAFGHFLWRISKQNWIRNWKIPPFLKDGLAELERAGMVEYVRSERRWYLLCNKDTQKIIDRAVAAYTAN